MVFQLRAVANNDNICWCSGLIESTSYSTIVDLGGFIHVGALNWKVSVVKGWVVYAPNWYDWISYTYSLQPTICMCRMAFPPDPRHVVSHARWYAWFDYPSEIQ